LGGPLDFCSVATLGSAGLTAVGVAGVFLSVFVCDDCLVEVGCFVGEHAPDLWAEAVVADDFDDDAVARLLHLHSGFAVGNRWERQSFSHSTQTAPGMEETDIDQLHRELNTN